MSEAAKRLALKYKTISTPNTAQILHFKMLTNQYRREGHSLEQAGQKAAEKAFRIDEQIIRKSQGDTLEALLTLIESENREGKL